VPVVAIVMIGGWLFAARRDADGSISSAGTLSVYDLRVGDCFDENSDADEIVSVDARPCDEAHEYEVYHDAQVSSASYPGDAFWDGVFVDECVGAFQAYVGEPYETSAIYATWYIPSEESWADGDRIITCVLYDPEDPRLSASLRGARR
jgi:hypothetical protein